VVLIVSSVLGYFFFAGERTFGTEYLHGRYGLGTGVAGTVLVVIGSGALIGVFAGGRIADRLRTAAHRSARIVVPAAAYFTCALLFVPSLIAGLLFMATPILFLAAAALEAAKARATRLDSTSCRQNCGVAPRASGQSCAHSPRPPRSRSASSPTRSAPAEGTGRSAPATPTASRCHC
jgi:predicted MFS family arabinose efflux permease